jgi:exocyst complex component 8
MSRQCIFEGDLQLYIFQVSFVYFTLVRNTISVYQQCFPPWMSSACIKWATEHLGDLNTLLTRQLSSIERDTPTWKECIGIVDEHAAMLTEVGVDFYDIIIKGLTDGHRDHYRSHDRNGAASAKRD